VHQSPSDVQPFPRGTETPTAWLQKPKNSYCSTIASIVVTIGNGWLHILSQNSEPINTFSWTSPVLDFIQGKFHICPLIKYAFHCIDFHYLAITELPQCSNGICCSTVHRIYTMSLKSQKLVQVLPYLLSVIHVYELGYHVN
jgi:hypothetical protein